MQLVRNQDLYEGISSFKWKMYFLLLPTVFILSSSKLGLDAGSSALSPPEMLFRTWGGRIGRSLYPKDVSEGGWCRLQDCIYLTARPESSKNTHPGTGTAFGGRKDLSEKNLGAWFQAGREGNRNLAFATCKTKLLPTAAVALEGLRLYCTVLPVPSWAQMPRYFGVWKHRKPLPSLANL